MLATQANFALFLATVSLAVWACATLDSNPRPERFKASGLAECATQLLHVW